jgi:NADP-dependent 3-hydroxy acid dehydrogenase YdfG
VRALQKDRCISALIAVTGGGTGLGLVTANALADNGATVYITGRRLEPLQSAAREADPVKGTGAIIPVQADVGTKEGIRSESGMEMSKRGGSADGQSSETTLKKRRSLSTSWSTVSLQRLRGK